MTKDSAKNDNFDHVYAGLPMNPDFAIIAMSIQKYKNISSYLYHNSVTILLKILELECFQLVLLQDNASRYN